MPPKAAEEFPVAIRNTSYHAPYVHGSNTTSAQLGTSMLSNQTGGGAPSAGTGQAGIAGDGSAGSDGSVGSGAPDVPMTEDAFEAALPPVGNALKQLDPRRVTVVARNYDSPTAGGSSRLQDSFVDLFRACTPYIRMHQGKEMVIHLTTELLDKPKLFEEIMGDVATLAILGVRPVVIVGIGDQINKNLRELGLEPKFFNRFRISDAETMRVVQQVTGVARARVEAALARGRASMASTTGVSVVSSNLLYTAQPVGVRDGVDFKQTGEVRKIEVERIRAHLDQGAVVLLTGLGYSASGEIFNVPTMEVASRAAAGLRASKLVYLTSDAFVQSTRRTKEKLVQSMRLAEAKALVEYHAASCATDPSVAIGCDVDDAVADGTSEEQAAGRMLSLCRYCVKALEGGVNRAHFVPPLSGSLLQEFYTLDGAGTLIARDLYDGIRLATAADVAGIVDLIAPLEAAGILVMRPRDLLTRDVHQGFYYVLTRDDQILSTAMLKRYSKTSAELGCLVVSKRYRQQGNGDAMLAFIERTALQAGVRTLFALSTHTMQWFIERGFTEGSLEQLPPARQRLYNAARGSKIYLKTLTGSRSVDAQELFWSSGKGPTG